MITQSVEKINTYALSSPYELYEEPPFNYHDYKTSHAKVKIDKRSTRMAKREYKVTCFAKIG